MYQIILNSRINELTISIFLQSYLLSSTASTWWLANYLQIIKKFGAMVLDDGTTGVVSSPLKSATHWRMPCFWVFSVSIFVTIYKRILVKEKHMCVTSQPIWLGIIRFGSRPSYILFLMHLHVYKFVDVFNVFLYPLSQYI